MEWYPVSCVTNAKDQEWVPSPDSLCQWETGPPQTWECLEANGGEFYQQIGHQIGSKDPFTVSGWNIWCEDMWSDHTDFQLDNLEGIGRPNDDMILNCCSSAANKKSHRSINMECDSGYQCQCEGCWPMDGFCSEAIRQVQWMDYCASYFLSPSISWENETDMETVQHVPCSINDQESNSPAKVSMINIVIPAGNENIKSACGGATLKEISLEESVLHGLEMVTSQLTEETRICFRNALYRLADHSSRQQLNQYQGSTNMGNDSSNSPPPPPPSSEHNNKRNKRMTQRRRITKESETNIIERTVAKMSDLAQQQPQNNMLEEERP